MHTYRGCTPLRSRASLDLGSLESWGGIFPSVLNHHWSSAGCFPDGMCALCQEQGCCLAGILVSIVNETKELSWDEKRVGGGRKTGRGEKSCSLFMQEILHVELGTTSLGYCCLESYWGPRLRWHRNWLWNPNTWAWDPVQYLMQFAWFRQASLCSLWSTVCWYLIPVCIFNFGRIYI